MRKALASGSMAVLLLFFAAWTARASQVAVSRKLGIGGMLGSPTGFSLKYFFHKQHAIDFGTGFQWFYDPALGIHVDYKFHLYLAKPEAFELALFFGAGPKLLIWFNDHCHYYWGGKSHCRESYVGFGVRFPVGVSFHFNKLPLDVFIEAAPVVGFYPWLGVFVDGGAGVRYYF